MGRETLGREGGEMGGVRDVRDPIPGHWGRGASPDGAVYGTPLPCSVQTHILYQTEWNLMIMAALPAADTYARPHCRLF